MTLIRTLCFRLRGVLLLCTIVMGCASPGTPPQESDPWQLAQEILETVKAPEFPDQTFNVMDYGAFAEGEKDDLPAFRAAILACSEAGGGRVLVPAGTYFLQGPIHFESHVNLHLEEGALVKFSPEPAHYLPVVHTRWEGVECLNYSPLIYAFEKEQIAITGKGTFDGQASEVHWWPWKSTKNFPIMGPDGSSTSSRDLLIAQNREEVLLEKRVFGAGHHLRPNFVQPYRCKQVWIQGVTFRNSPMWVMHPVLCQGVLIEGVSVISHGPNSDGCDPESCRDVVIRDCYFDTGDDCIALKSGRNQDGRRIGVPIERVVVQNCLMKDGHGGIVVGSEVSGGARQIFGEKCRMDSPNLDRAIRIKTNRSRGGTIEQLYFRDIEVGTVKESVVKVNMRYTLDDTISITMPVVRDIRVENVTSAASQYGVQLMGYDDEFPITGVVIRNCRFEGVREGNVLEHATSTVFDSLFLNGTQVFLP